VQRICGWCITCKQVKFKVMPNIFYTSLPVPKKSWVDISMDFILGSPSLRKGRDYNFFFIDRFSRMTQFITCHKTNDAMNIINLLFREVVRLHGVLRSIVFN